MRDKVAALSVLSLALLIALTVASGQEPVSVNKNYVAWAEDFLRAMYPSLNDKRYALSLEGWTSYDEPGGQIRHFSQSIGEGPNGEYSKVIGRFAGFAKAPEDFRPGPQYYKQFLKAGFTFDEHDHLLDFGASGVAVGNSEARNKYYGLLVIHGDLTQAEINATLRQYGFKYGPDGQEAFAKNLPVKELERFVGKIESVTIKPIEGNVTASGVVQWVDWNVFIQTSQSDGTKLRYQLFFDPFRGDQTWLDTALQPRVQSAPK